MLRYAVRQFLVDNETALDRSITACEIRGRLGMLSSRSKGKVLQQQRREAVPFPYGT